MNNENKQLCKMCQYSMTIDRFGDVMCDYLCQTYKRRPCPAEDCTVFKPRKSRKVVAPFGKRKK